MRGRGAGWRKTDDRCRHGGVVPQLLKPLLDPELEQQPLERVSTMAGVLGLCLGLGD